MSTIQPQAYILIEKIIAGGEICIFKKYFCNMLNLDINVINLYTIWKGTFQSTELHFTSKENIKLLWSYKQNNSVHFFGSHCIWVLATALGAAVFHRDGQGGAIGWGLFFRAQWGIKWQCWFIVYLVSMCMYGRYCSMGVIFHLFSGTFKNLDKLVSN